MSTDVVHSTLKILLRQDIFEGRFACRWEAWTPIVGAVVTILIFVALPAYFYQHKFKAIGNCGADMARYM